MLTILAIPSLFVAPLAAMVAYGYFKDGDKRNATKAGLVTALTLSIYLIASNGDSVKFKTGDCYRDWDGRANRMVCDN